MGSEINPMGEGPLEPGAIRFGHIVFAHIPGSGNQACVDPHPAMVLRGPDPLGDLWLIGISTQFEPGRLVIELPWSPEGHPVTGLWKRCALRCDWIVPWNVRDIRRRLGIVPSDLAERAVEYVISSVEEKKKATGT